MAFCLQADLENALGGAAKLLELADFNRTGNINDAGVQSTIQGWLDDEAATIRSKAEVKHDPEILDNLDAPSLRKLLDANATLSARTAFEKGTTGMALPTNLESRAARIDKYLDELATGAARLGRVSGGKVAALNQSVGVVDYDPTATGISVAAFRGSGFR